MCFFTFLLECLKTIIFFRPYIPCVGLRQTQGDHWLLLRSTGKAIKPKHTFIVVSHKNPPPTPFFLQTILCDHCCERNLRFVRGGQLHFFSIDLLAIMLEKVPPTPSSFPTPWLAVRVGHRVLFRSERSVLFHSFKECNVLFRFFQFLATSETQKNILFFSVLF